jgi:hypothetical protein
MRALGFIAFALCAGGLLAVAPAASIAQPSEFPPETLPPKKDPPSIDPERPGQDGEADAGRIISAIAEAHRAAEWRKRRGVQANILVALGNEERLAGKLIYDYRNNRMRLEQPSGVAVIFDGEDAWSVPEGHADRQTVHRLRAYAFCLAAPFMLSDPKAERAVLDQMLIRGRSCDMVRLTHPAPTEDEADSSDGGAEPRGDDEEPLTGRPDWLIALADQRSRRLLGLAYAPPVVELSLPDVADGPRLLLYEGYREVDGVLLSTRWQFFSWSNEWGVQGQPLGWARLSELTFVEPIDDWFERPAEDGEPAEESG